ncbi:MAG: DNA mismatch repair endonuclease MutL, partial [bacterium]|nr:DNA mismatch repair endonuclease MutL [bacterium]
TLGFRGEALAAIASVSRIEAISRVKGRLSGFRLRLTGGRRESCDEVGCPEGSTLLIRDLFFNTPVRKKFLKSREVENGHLINVFKRYAIAYPEMRWSISMDDRNLYRLPIESQESRICAVFNQDFSSRIFPLQSVGERLSLTGYIGSPELARRSRTDQYLYVNRRWVANRLLGHAVNAAYGPLLEEGKFPFYALYLQIAPQDVDVNVHPAKTEIKFRKESEIYGFIQQAVADTLQQAGLKAFSSMQLRSGEKFDDRTGEITAATKNDLGAIAVQFAQRKFHSSTSGHNYSNEPIASGEAYRLVFTPPVDPAADQSPDSRENSNSISDRAQVYQFHQRYILTEIKGGIAIIDQHAAHERVLYERALKALVDEQLPSQQLLFPKIMEFDVESAVRLREVLDYLQKLGITLRVFGERSFVLEALPAGIRDGASEEIIKDILDELQERGEMKQPGQEQVAAAFACRAAIKFGQSLTLAEMNGLIDQLFAAQFPFTCPHGRPTLMQLTLGELERRFGRS